MNIQNKKKYITYNKYTNVYYKKFANYQLVVVLFLILLLCPILDDNNFFLGNL